MRKACAIGKKLRELGIRHYGVVRIDSAAVPRIGQAIPPETRSGSRTRFAKRATSPKSYGERLAAEGEICWGGMHSWKHMVELLETVDRPKTLGFQADMAHTMLYTLGYNSPENRLLPEDFDWSEARSCDGRSSASDPALRPWTIDFHVAQNDGTVKGSGSHDKTGRHCLPNDPNGKMDIVKVAGLWMRDDNGVQTRAFQHICWDGCMFPNAMMLTPDTWREILATMIKVRDAHGWD